MKRILKTLIIFYSRKGRTREIARKWAHEIGASRLEILPMAYRDTWKEYFKYMFCTLTRRPMEIDLYHIDFQKYDRIVLMIPVVHGMMSAPMRSFILQEEGNLHNVEYVIVHKGLKARQPRLVKWLDRHLQTEHLACSSIQQHFNRSYKINRIDGNSVLTQVNKK